MNTPKNVSISLNAQECFVIGVALRDYNKMFHHDIEARTAAILAENYFSLGWIWRGVWHEPEKYRAKVEIFFGNGKSENIGRLMYGEDSK